MGRAGRGQGRLGTTLSCRPADAAPAGTAGAGPPDGPQAPRRPLKPRALASCPKSPRSLGGEAPMGNLLLHGHLSVTVVRWTHAWCSGRSPEPVTHCGFQNAIWRLSSSHCFHGSSGHRWGPSAILCDNSTSSDGPVRPGLHGLRRSFFRVSARPMRGSQSENRTEKYVT